MRLEGFWRAAMAFGALAGAALAAEEGKLAPSARFGPVVYARAAMVSSELCPKADAAPKVDGALDDAAWKNALSGREFFLLGNGRTTPAKTQTHVFFTWDDANLYVGARCFDPKARELKAPAKLDKADGNIGWGESVELFLDVSGTGEEAYQIAVDLAGNVWDGHHKADDSLDQGWSSKAVAAVGREDGAWTLEMALPLKSFDAKALAGRTWGLNLGRNAMVFPGESSTAWCGAYLAPKVFQRALFARPAAAAVTQISRGEGVTGENKVQGVVASLTDESREIEARCTLTLAGAQPRTEKVQTALPGRGKAGFELAYAIPAAWMAKNPQGKGVTLAVEVADLKTKQVLWSSAGTMDAPPAITLELDRKVYGFDHVDGQAFLTVNVSPSLLEGAAVRLALTPEGAARPAKGQLLTCADRRATLGMDWAGLAPGNYELSATLMAGGEVLGTAVAAFAKAEGQTREAARSRVPLIVKPVAAGVKSWPVTTGVPFAPGVLRGEQNVRLLGPDGQEAPCQVRTTARWTPNGYAQWLLVDFAAQVAADREVTYQLEYGNDVKRASFASPLKVEEDKDGVTVVTGPLKFVTPRAKGQWLGGVWLDANGDGRFAESERVAGGGSAWLAHHTGAAYASDQTAPQEVVVEEQGPQRVALKVAGWKQSAAGVKSGQYVTRIMAYAGEPFVRVYHTLVLTEDSRKVRYRDLALGLETPGLEGATLGGADGKAIEAGSGVSLTQDQWDHFFVRGAAKAEGKQAAGWMTGRAGQAAVTVTVQDFWQNYPKELEAADGRMVVHLWPAHNAPRRHEVKDLNAHNVHMLYYAHEGEELDFQMPREFATKFTKEAKPEFYYIPGAVDNANAMGVAKTHEMTWHFHKAGESPAAVSKAFAEGVFCMAAPEWMCAARTFRVEPMQPADAKAYPDEEWAISAMWDNERRLEELTTDYGMWNFKDGHNGWIPEEKRWGVNRTWRNTHHGSPRVAWILYARSGDPKYLVYARRNTRHCMDMDFCHFSTPESEALSYPRQKIKGALNDYKGLVHWHAGGRLFDYNNMADFLLYNYYMTGDRRSLDVLDEWREAAVARYHKPSAGRGGAGPLATLLATYQHTWDERLWPLIQAYARAMMASQAADGSIGGWHEYAPWLNRYHAFTGDPAAKACLEKWLAWHVKDLKTATAYFHPHLWMQNYGYFLTGKEEYLAAALGRVRIAIDSVYRNPGHLYDGYWTGAISVDAGYLLQDLPVFLFLLKQHGKPVAPIYYGRQIVEASAGPWRIVAREEKDGAVRFRTELGSQSKPVGYKLTGPDGKVIAEGQTDPKKTEFAVEAPADGKTGEYALTLTAETGMSFIIPFTDMPKEVLDTAWRQVTFVRQPKAAFFAPAGIQEATLDIAQHTDANAVALYDGQGRLALRRYWVGAEERAQKVKIEPKPDQQGQAWLVSFGDKTKRNMLTLPKTLPPYVAIDQARMFVPAGK